MRMFKCKYCGAIFEEPHIRTYKESREFWGMPCYEEFVEETCPECGDYDFDEYDEDEEEEDEEEC